MRYVWRSISSTTSCYFQRTSVVTYRSNTNVHVRLYPCLMKHHSTEAGDRIEIQLRAFLISDSHPS